MWLQKAKVSFDWDDTASLSVIRKFMSLFNKNYTELYIITARAKHENKEIKIAKALFSIDYSIKEVYLDGANKWSTLEKMGIDYHFDDMVEEIQLIQAHCTKTTAFLVSQNIGEAMWEASNLTIKNT